MPTFGLNALGLRSKHDCNDDSWDTQHAQGQMDGQADKPYLDCFGPLMFKLKAVLALLTVAILTTELSVSKAVTVPAAKCVQQSEREIEREQGRERESEE